MSAEGVPVAWAVVDRHGVLLPNSNEAAEVACFRTKDEADEELAYANQGEGAPPWEDSKPFAVVALAPTHPAAASAEAQPTRGDVGRPESTRDPVFLLRWRPKKCDPGRDRWHVEGVWFTREEAEQFAKAHAYRWGSDQFGPCWHVYCVPAEGEMARLLKTVTKRDDALSARATKEVS